MMQELHHGGVVAAGVLDRKGAPRLRRGDSQESVTVILKAICGQ
jgi:hypothetical protein